MKELDWANLPFGYMKTDYNVRIYYRDGKWGERKCAARRPFPMHMAATCLHYGQEAFEGLKAFRGKDGKSVCSARRRMPPACNLLAVAS